HLDRGSSHLVRKALASHPGGALQGHRAVAVPGRVAMRQRPDERVVLSLNWRPHGMALLTRQYPCVQRLSPDAGGISLLAHSTISGPGGCSDPSSTAGHDPELGRAAASARHRAAGLVFARRDISCQLAD